MFTNILLILIIAGFAGALLGAWLAGRRLRAVVLDFLTAAEPGSPSPLATAADILASMIGRAVAAQLKTSLMGMESGLKRGERTIEEAASADIMAQSPLSGILDGFPTVKKTLRRNPQLLDAALGLISKMGGSQVSPGNGSRPRFSL